MNTAANLGASARSITLAKPWALSKAIVAAILGSALLLLTPALWNGYVLLYYDSVDYIRMAFDWNLPVYRTMPYALFGGGIGRLAGTLWAVPVVQSLLVSYVLYEALHVFSPFRPSRALLPVAAILWLATGLPWFTSQMMADVFTGLVVLGIAILAFGGNKLSRPRQSLMLAAVVIGITVHTSHLAIGIGLVASLAALRWLLRERWPEVRPAILMPALAVVLAAAGILAIHKITVGRAFITQPTSVLMLGRLVQDGIARQLLNDTCPKVAKPYNLCAVRDKLPPTANDFLWGNTPFYRLGGWDGMRDEAAAIVAQSLHDYPMLHVEAAAELTFQQLGMFKTGDGVNRMGWLIGNELRKYYPRELSLFEHSRQEKGIDFKWINRIDVTVLTLSQLALAGILWLAWKRRDRLAFALPTVVVLALLGNAFVCGALSNPNHRYQSRIVWVATFTVMAAGARLLASRRREDETETPAKAG